jgi:undecaprenyl diphosphate synthase
MALDPTSLPQHVAIIMDGNGRWAQCQGLPRVEGHRRGAKSVRTVVRAAREIGLKALTLYAFSAQNWRRPNEEVGLLMQLLHDYLIEERSEIMENGIRLTAIGQVSRLPGFVREPLDALISDSANNLGMTLCLALSYGGRESIVEAASALAQKVVSGEISAADISENMFSEALQTGHLPQLDLLIRTSGEQRLSNFMLWEASYAELCFTETLWPEFGREHLLTCLEQYGNRERRFGLTGDQLRPAIRSVG